MANESEKDILKKVGTFGLQTPLTMAFFLKTKLVESIVATVIQGAVKKKLDEEYMLQEIAKEEQSKMSNLNQYHNEEEQKQAKVQQQTLNQSPLTKPKNTEDTSASEIRSTTILLVNVRQKIEERKKLYTKYEENINEVDQFIDALDKKLNNKKIRELSEEEKNEVKSSLQKKIDQIAGTQVERDNESKEVFRLVDLGMSDPRMMAAAQEKMNDINARNLQVGTLNDMLSVIKGEKVMYDINGNKVDSFEKADFIVPEGKKIVKQGDEFYLLNKIEELSTQNELSAKAAFKRAEPEISSVKHFIQANKNLEMTALSKEVASLSQKMIELQKSSAKTISPLTKASCTPSTNHYRKGDEASFRKHHLGF